MEIATHECIAQYRSYLKTKHPELKAAPQYVKVISGLIKNKGASKDLPAEISRWKKESKKNKSTVSILNKFEGFVSKAKITSLSSIKDTPIMQLIDAFSEAQPGKLKSKVSVESYRAVLEAFAAFALYKTSNFNRVTVRNFIEKEITQADGGKRRKGNRTLKFYKSVLSAFAKWGIECLTIRTPMNANSEEKQILHLFKTIGHANLLEITMIHVEYPGYLRMDRKPLTVDQRDALLKLCTTAQDRCIVALMAWNGLRVIEVLRLQLKDCDLENKVLWISGKGKQGSDKTVIAMMTVVKETLSTYLRELTRDANRYLFEGISEKEIVKMICKYLEEIGVRKKDSNTKFTAESLRNTAGQIMYDSGIPLELIHKTLRNTDLKATFKFAEHALEKKYFSEMKLH